MDALSIRIFVVEDDPLMQDLLEDALIEGGFAVVKAESGEDAIRMLDAQVGGREARARIAARNSGRLHDGRRGGDWTANGVPNSVLISKPFAAAQIVTAVSQLLNKANTSGA